MMKSRLQFSVCFAMIFAGLAGCSPSPGRNVGLTSEQIIETTIQESETVNQFFNTDQTSDIVLAQTSEAQQIAGGEAIDYSQYQNKLWVFEDWNGEAYENYCSFIITGAKDGVIKGKLGTSLLIDTFYYNQPNDKSHLGTLTGQIFDGIAECQFYDDSGNDGNVILKFNDNDRIEVTINYIHKNSLYTERQLNGSYLVRPYNISDVQNLVIDESLSFSMELDSWGQVYFVSGERIGNKPTPVVFFTNEKQDILYEFSAPYPTASYILDINARDWDEDGLIDVEIITYFPDVPDLDHIRWLFYQTDNGLFYGEKPEPIAQTTSSTKEKPVSVIDAQVLLRERFGEYSKISYLPDMDTQEEGVWHYCFSVDYSNIVERDTPILYAWINSNTGDEIFQEKGYTETGILYTNIPDPMFPVPMIDNTVIPYAYFMPPNHDSDLSTFYMYDDLSIMNSYREQLKEAGFIDYGNVMSVESLWRYEREEDGATLVLEIYTYDKAFSVVMYVNYLKR